MNATLPRLTRIAGLPRRFRPGEFVFHQGSDVGGVSLVRSGTIRLARLSLNGDEVTIAYVGEGECFGEAEVLLGLESRECFAQATSKATISPIFLRDLTPEHLAELRQAAVARLYRAQLYLADMIVQPPARRVSSLLLHLGSQRPTIRLSHDEIAMTIGCPRETVSRTLLKLKGSGAISVDRCAITILDPSLLEGYPLPGR